LKQFIQYDWKSQYVFDVQAQPRMSWLDPPTRQLSRAGRFSIFFLLDIKPDFA
jgi:hypothetical protein